MPWLNVVLGLYAALNIFMGWHGFIGAHSIPSLIAGNVAGLLVIGSILYTKKNPRLARIASLVIAVLLIGWATPDVIKKGNVYPKGVDLVCSIIVVGCLGYGHMAGMKARQAKDGA